MKMPDTFSRQRDTNMRLAAPNHSIRCVLTKTADAYNDHTRAGAESWHSLRIFSASSAAAGL